MRELIRAFCKERSVVNHHIASFNDFLPTPENPNSRMQRIVDAVRVNDDMDEKGVIYLDQDKTGDDVIAIRLGRRRDENSDIDPQAKGTIFVKTPIVKEANGAEHPLSPMEARLRNLTYQAPIFLECSVIENGIEREPEMIHIGDLPIMIKSKKCNLDPENISYFFNRMDEDIANEDYVRLLASAGEDPCDPGGYFIISGTERVLISLEDLAPNRVLVEVNSRYGKDMASRMQL